MHIGNLQQQYLLYWFLVKQVKSQPKTVSWIIKQAGAKYDDKIICTFIGSSWKLRMYVVNDFYQISTKNTLAVKSCCQDFKILWWKMYTWNQKASQGLCRNAVDYIIVLIMMSKVAMVWIIIIKLKFLSWSTVFLHSSWLPLFYFLTTAFFQVLVAARMFFVEINLTCIVMLDWHLKSRHTVVCRAAKFGCARHCVIYSNQLLAVFSRL